MTAKVHRGKLGKYGRWASWECGKRGHGDRAIALTDEQFSWVPRRYQCASCRRLRPTRGWESATPEMEAIVESLCLAVARVGADLDAMRSIEHRCFFDGERHACNSNVLVGPDRKAKCGRDPWPLLTAVVPYAVECRDIIIGLLNKREMRETAKALSPRLALTDEQIDEILEEIEPDIEQWERTAVLKRERPRGRAS